MGIIYPDVHDDDDGEFHEID